MKKIIVITSLFILFTGTSLYAQKSAAKNNPDTTKVMLQALLNPSLQNVTDRNLKLSTNYLFDFTNNKIPNYINTFNSITAKFLLAQTSDNFTMRDYPSFKPEFYNPHNAFQYNFIQGLKKFNFRSDLLKSTW